MSNFDPYLFYILLQIFKCIILVKTFQFDAVKFVKFNLSETRVVKLDFFP